MSLISCAPLPRRIPPRGCPRTGHASTRPRPRRAPRRSGRTGSPAPVSRPYRCHVKRMALSPSPRASSWRGPRGRAATRSFLKDSKAESSSADSSYRETVARLTAAARSPSTPAASSRARLGKGGRRIGGARRDHGPDESDQDGGADQRRDCDGDAGEDVERRHYRLDSIPRSIERRVSTPGRARIRRPRRSTIRLFRATRLFL